MQSWAAPEFSPSSGKPAPFSDECFSDVASASDTDNFVKTLARIRSKGVRPDLIGSIITHYASKYLPGLAGDDARSPSAAAAAAEGESAAAARRRQRRFIETVVGILPQEKDCVPCSFLLRLLHAAAAAGVGAGCHDEIERRVSWQLDRASLKDLVIASSGRAAAPLDFEVVVRLVRRFVANEEEVARSGAALVKVAKLVDGYLAEAAADSDLKLPQFVALATALPCHARSSDDGIYRAIDIYLKAHPSLSKQERRRLCMLIESRKLSKEASLHAVQNERLPVRAVIQVLLWEQDKLRKHIDWSGSLSGPRSPGIGPDATARYLSKREPVRQQMEMKRLKEDVLMLQSQCMRMERQIERLMEKKKKKKMGYFSWKKIGNAVFKGSYKIGGVEGVNTPMQTKGGRSSNKWRKWLMMKLILHLHLQRE